MDLFKYVKPDGFSIGDLNETITAFLENGDDLSKMSTLAFRAAALFSEEQVLYVSAWVALEQARRWGRIDDKLITLLNAGR